MANFVRVSRMGGAPTPLCENDSRKFNSYHDMCEKYGRQIAEHNTYEAAQRRATTRSVAQLLATPGLTYRPPTVGTIF